MTAYRRTPHRLLLTGLVVIVALAVAYDGWIADNTGDAYTGLGRRLINLPLLLTLGFLGVGMFRMGIWTDDKAVLVRNLVRTYRFPWTSVVAIRPPSVWGGRSPRKSGVVFVLSDGREISARVYSPSVLDRPGWGDELAAELWSQRQRFA